MLKKVRVILCYVLNHSVALFEISSLLSTGLDKKTLGILMDLIDEGINPEALACAVKELQATKESNSEGQSFKDDKSFHH